MAQYFYSLPTQDFLNLSIRINNDKPVSFFQKDYLPPALKSQLKEIIGIVKSDAAVCFDPQTGEITIDQIRMYAYKSHYSKNEVKARKGLVNIFINNAKSPIKEFAEEKVKNLDWDNDEKFKKTMEDILVEYEARAAFDPETFPPYGMLYRHTYLMNITKQGLKTSFDSEGVPEYFTDQEYHKEHMEKVSKRLEEIKSSGEASKADERDFDTSYRWKNEPFFDLFGNGQDGGIGR